MSRLLRALSCWFQTSMKRRFAQADLHYLQLQKLNDFFAAASKCAYSMQEMIIRVWVYVVYLTQLGIW